MSLYSLGWCCDDDLIRLSLSGREDAWNVLMRKHLPYLRVVTRRLASNPSDAEDVLAITMAKAWRGLSSFQQGASFGTWLHQIAKHASVDLCRRDSLAGCLSLDTEPDDPEAQTLSGYLLDPAPGPEEIFLAQEEAREVERLLGRLPPYFREPILMQLNGYAYEEIAALMGTGVGTVRSRLHRGKRILKQLLVASC